MRRDMRDMNERETEDLENLLRQSAPSRAPAVPDELFDFIETVPGRHGRRSRLGLAMERPRFRLGFSLAGTAAALVIAITALELGLPLGALLIKLCVIVGAPLLAVANADAILRIWRAAWAWMPVDRTKGLFRLAWVATAAILWVVLIAVAVLALLA